MDNNNNKSRILEWYNGKTIFITGATGFMGKVLLEKLLFSCPKIGNIYILIRPKRGNSAEKRIENMWQLPMFERLRKSQPEAIKKIIPINDDLNSADLNPADLNLLTDNVNIIFHVAATLKLDATLKDAIIQNIGGTVKIIDIAKKCKNLQAFVHFSTAFCAPDIDIFEEKIYPCREKPRDIVDVARWMNDEALERAKTALIAPHVNTYTYTKRLAENLVGDEYPNLPTCVIRPSIVIPAAFEPLPGWVDSLNGPMGLLVGAGKGVIRSMYAKVENRTHFVPVDGAINVAITVAHKLANDPKPENIPVYNLTQDDVLPMRIGDILNMGREITYENPFEMQIWYPDGDIRSSKLQHMIMCIFLHWLPACFIDLLLLIACQKRFMLRVQKKIHDGLDQLEFFGVRRWNIKGRQFLDLNDNYLDENDRKVLPMDYNVMDVRTYMTTAVLGARQYLMKEDLSSLPRCRIQQKILFVLHKILVYGLYTYILWTLYSIIMK